MPFIPPSLFSLDSYLAQGPAQATLNISPLSIDIPDIPPLPSRESAMAFFSALWQAIIAFFAEVPENAEKFAKEHLEHAKIGGIIVLAVVAMGLVSLALPVLLPVLAAVGTGLASVGVILVFNVTKYLFVKIAAGILHLVGFTAGGVAGGSAAAIVQSVVYGPFTTGLFSVLQSLGVTIGRLALAVVP